MRGGEGGGHQGRLPRQRDAGAFQEHPHPKVHIPVALHPVHEFDVAHSRLPIPSGTAGAQETLSLALPFADHVGVRRLHRWVSLLYDGVHANRR